MFTNLLSLRPLFDIDNIYRYIIAMQFQPISFDIYEKCLFNRVLNCLPHKLLLRSKSMQKARGTLAISVSGTSNFSVLNKEEIYEKAMLQKQSVDWMSNAQRQTLKAALASVPEENDDVHELDYSCVIFSFTKIIWLNTPMDAMKAIVGDPIGREMFSLFCSITSTVYHTHFEFCCYCEDIAKLQVSA